LTTGDNYDFEEAATQSSELPWGDRVILLIISTGNWQNAQRKMPRHKEEIVNDGRWTKMAA